MTNIKESFIFPLYNFVIFLWIIRIKTGEKSITKILNTNSYKLNCGDYAYEMQGSHRKLGKVDKN